MKEITMQKSRNKAGSGLEKTERELKEKKLVMDRGDELHAASNGVYGHSRLQNVRPSVISRTF